MTRLDLSLYLVLDPDLCRRHTMLETARLAVAGGATVVQLRDKAAGTAERIAAGRALMAMLAGTGVPLVVNDDVDAAVAIGADGVHVGQGDVPAREVRRRLGPRPIVGLSAETVAAALAADPAVVDYLGVGPVFATATKPDHEPPIGLDGLRRIVAASPVPAVAIGGLDATHAPAVLAAGAAGLAVVSAVCGRPDPSAAARAIADAVRRSRSQG